MACAHLLVHLWSHLFVFMRYKEMGKYQCSFLKILFLVSPNVIQSLPHIVPCLPCLSWDCTLGPSTPWCLVLAWKGTDAEAACCKALPTSPAVGDAIQLPYLLIFGFVLSSCSGGGDPEISSHDVGLCVTPFNGKQYFCLLYSVLSSPHVQDYGVLL